MHPLHSFFYPQVIAVIGASDRYGSAGRAVFGQLLANLTASRIVPVNVNHKTIGGMKTYANLTEMAQEIIADIVIVILSADKIASIVREANKLNIKNIIIINDLEQPTPTIRNKLERAADIAQKAQMRLLTVPTFGVMNLFLQQNSACAYIGQSVSIGDCLQHYAKGRGVQFSRFITLNPQKNDTISTGQIIDFVASESKNKAILVQINTLDNTRELISALTAAARHHTVFMLNTLPESNAENLLNQALERNHIFCVSTFTEFLTAAKLFHTHVSAQGRRIGIVSNTPQISALTLKSLPQMDLILAQPNTATQRGLVKFLPNKAAVTNPLYLPTDTVPSLFQAACEAFLQDEQIDAVCLIYVGTNISDSHCVAQIVGQLQTRYPRKPLLLTWLGSADNPEIRALFNQNKNLHFRQPENALDALVQLNRYREHRHTHQQNNPFYDYRAATQAATLWHEQLASPITDNANKPNPSQFFNVLDDALDGLQKHLRPLLPVSKSMMTQVFDALKLQPTKKSTDTECVMTWAHQPLFGQLITLTAHDKTVSLLPPLTPLILNNALNQLDLPHLIWQDWFLDAAEVLFRLPEITQLQVALHHDVKKGICGNDLKIQILHDTHWQNENVFTPYPFEYEEILTLKNGTTATIRPIRPEDATLITQHVAQLSERSRQMRFASQSAQLPPNLLVRLSQPDYQREFALLVHDEALRPLAMANYTADADRQSCEFGISLIDEMQGQGLGAILMTHLITRARQQGFVAMRAEILSENYPMQKLALKMGFTLAKHENDSTMIAANLIL